MPTDYKQLLVWQRSMDLVVGIYRLSRNFPKDELFGLTNQLRRASVSIPSNIAEGQGRKTNAEFVRYLRIANGSRQEVETQLILAHRLSFLDQEEVEAMGEHLREIGRLISGLIRKLDN